MQPSALVRPVETTPGLERLEQRLLGDIRGLLTVVQDQRQALHQTGTLALNELFEPIPPHHFLRVMSSNVYNTAAGEILGP